MRNAKDRSDPRILQNSLCSLPPSFVEGESGATVACKLWEQLP